MIAQAVVKRTSIVLVRSITAVPLLIIVKVAIIIMNNAQIKHLHHQVEVMRKHLELLTNQFEAIKDIVDHEESLLPVEENESF